MLMKVNKVPKESFCNHMLVSPVFSLLITCLCTCVSRLEEVCSHKGKGKLNLSKMFRTLKNCGNCNFYKTVDNLNSQIPSLSLVCCFQCKNLDIS